MELTFPLLLTLALFSIIVIIAACAVKPLFGNKGEPGLAYTDYARNGQDSKVYVEDINITILDSFPARVDAIISGEFPDNSSQIKQVEVFRSGNTFTVELTIAHPKGTKETQITTSFEAHVDLDVDGLPTGKYFIKAGNRCRAFILPAETVQSKYSSV